MTADSKRYSRILNESIRAGSGASKDKVVNSLISLSSDKQKISDAVKNCSVNVTKEEKSFLENYLSELDEELPWARKIEEEEHSKAKQKAFRQANSELEELEKEIQRAIDEEYTLEQIASALRDPRIAEEAEMSMSELENIQERIERLADKKDRTGELLQKFEQVREKTGGKESILHGLKVRKTAVEEVLSVANIRDTKDGKKVPIDVPEWEQDRFDDNVIYTAIEESKDVSEMLENAKKLVGFARDRGEINPDMNKKTIVRVGNIDYARKVSKDTSAADAPLFNHMDDVTVNVWMNGALTQYHLEGGIDSGFDRLIILHSDLLDSRFAVLATLVHELMHAYFEHKGNYSHRKIHQMSINVLGTPIKAEKENPDFTMEQLLKDLKPLTRKDINKAYLYAVASETLF